jgi:nucleoside-diphosphate-sugar epimerase
MKVLITGHDGYIGHSLVPLFLASGHELIGLDAFLYEHCAFAAEPAPLIPSIRKDIRDVTVDDLRGYTALVHLAAISNDPLGNYEPQTTYDINYHATVRLAEVAKQASVSRFLFSSSCSTYGAAGDAILDETAEFNPVTPYGESKVLAEQALRELADDSFTPVYLRSATAYGFSPRLRGDLVVNNLVGYAVTSGQVLIVSDGTPWRPLVHIEDIARAFLAATEAPAELVHDQAFNVGRSEENYQIRDVAALVEEVVPGSAVTYAPGGGPDLRCYRVTCEKIERTLPGFEPRWTVARGIAQLYEAFKRQPMTTAEFEGGRFLRIKHVTELREQGRLDADLRWREPVASTGRA